MSRSEGESATEKPTSEHSPGVRIVLTRLDPNAYSHSELSEASNSDVSTPFSNPEHEIIHLKRQVEKLKATKAGLVEKLKQTHPNFKVQKQPASNRKSTFYDENVDIVNKLQLHRYLGVCVTKYVNKQFVVEFNASYEGKYTSRFAVRFTKEGRFKMVRCCVPISINVEEIMKSKPVIDTEDFFNLVTHLQHCMMAYHIRGEHLKEAELEIKENDSIEYIKSTSNRRHIEIGMILNDIVSGAMTNISLVLRYKNDAVQPSSLKVESKDLDHKQQMDAEKQCGNFKHLTLKHAISLLLPRMKKDSTASSLSHPSPKPTRHHSDMEDDTHTSDAVSDLLVKRGSAKSIGSGTRRTKVSRAGTETYSSPKVGMITRKHRNKHPGPGATSFKQTTISKYYTAKPPSSGKEVDVSEGTVSSPTSVGKKTIEDGTKIMSRNRSNLNSHLKERNMSTENVKKVTLQGMDKKTTSAKKVKGNKTSFQGEKTEATSQQIKKKNTLSRKEPNKEVNTSRLVANTETDHVEDTSKFPERNATERKSHVKEQLSAANVPDERTAIEKRVTRSSTTKGLTPTKRERGIVHAHKTVTENSAKRSPKAVNANRNPGKAPVDETSASVYVRDVKRARTDYKTDLVQGGEVFVKNLRHKTTSEGAPVKSVDVLPPSPTKHNRTATNARSFQTSSESMSTVVSTDYINKKSMAKNTSSHVQTPKSLSNVYQSNVNSPSEQGSTLKHEVPVTRRNPVRSSKSRTVTSAYSNILSLRSGGIQKRTPLKLAKKVKKGKSDSKHISSPRVKTRAQKVTTARLQSVPEDVELF